MPVAVGTKALLSLKSGRPPSGGGGGRGTLGCEAFLGRKVPAPTPSVRPATKSREGPRVGIFLGWRVAGQVKAGSGQEREVSRQLFLFGCVRLENICNARWRFEMCN